MPNGGHRTRLKGTVTSDKMDKSVVVSVERITKHPLYKKYITRRKKYTAHDEDNRCRVGDSVEMISCRPFSKTKSWAIVKILKQIQPVTVTESLDKEQAK